MALNFLTLLSQIYLSQELTVIHLCIISVHTLKSEDQYLQDNWKKCLASEVQIPHHIIRVFDDRGDLDHIIHTRFLQDDESDDGDDEDHCDSNGDSSESGINHSLGQQQESTEDNSWLNQCISEGDDYDNDDDDNDEVNKDENNVISIVQFDEDLLDEDEQQEGLATVSEREESEAIFTQNLEAQIADNSPGLSRKIITGTGMSFAKAQTVRLCKKIIRPS